MALNPKQFPSEIVTLMRSEIQLCDYNPRTIDEEGRKLLKRSLKKFGVLGGIIVNKRNGNRVCGGNQKVALLDAVNKYPEKDYELRVEMIDVDDKTEKEIVVVLNNQAVGGQWDYDKLRELIPDIDYQSVGFSAADLSMIGCDFMFQSEEENNLNLELMDLMRPDAEAHQEELAQRRAERELLQEQSLELDVEDDEEDQQEDGLSYEDRVRAVKDMKAKIMNDAIEKASDMEAYFMVTFSTWRDKAEFLSQWGYDPQSKFIKGEDFAQRLEGFDEEE